MPENTSKFNFKIKKIIPIIYCILFFVGLIIFLDWFYNNVHKPQEKAYISASKYAYGEIQKELISFYKKHGYVFKNTVNNDVEFCEALVSAYSKDKVGNCVNMDSIMPIQNFIFEDKKISVLGLEKPAFLYDGSLVKDIIIDTDTQESGKNQVGVDRTILRIYSSGKVSAILTPVNCNKDDETKYGFKTSIYCIGSSGVNYLTSDFPLSFNIERIGAQDGKTKLISRNVSFLRADCTAFDGFITSGEDYCIDEKLYQLMGCNDEYSCNIALSK